MRRGILVEKLSGPSGSYGGTPKERSDRNETTAIRSAVADLPKSYIPRVRGARVETGAGGAAILMVKSMVKLQGSKKRPSWNKMGKVKARPRFSCESGF